MDADHRGASRGEVKVRTLLFQHLDQEVVDVGAFDLVLDGVHISILRVQRRDRGTEH